MSIRDPGDAESFLPSLDIRSDVIGMGLLSPSSGHRYFRESYIPRGERPGTAGSGRPRTGTSARGMQVQIQVVSGIAIAGAGAGGAGAGAGGAGAGARPHTAGSSRPRTGGSTRPHTGSSAVVMVAE